MNAVAGEVQREQTGELDQPQPASAVSRNSARGWRPKQHVSAGVSGAEQANLALSPAPQRSPTAGISCLLEVLCGPQQVHRQGGNVITSSPFPINEAYLAQALA